MCDMPTLERRMKKVIARFTTVLILHRPTEEGYQMSKKVYLRQGYQKNSNMNSPRQFSLNHLEQDNFEIRTFKYSVQSVTALQTQRTSKGANKLLDQRVNSKALRGNDEAAASSGTIPVDAVILALVSRHLSHTHKRQDMSWFSTEKFPEGFESQLGLHGYRMYLAECVTSVTYALVAAAKLKQNVNTKAGIGPLETLESFSVTTVTVAMKLSTQLNSCELLESRRSDSDASGHVGARCAWSRQLRRPVVLANRVKATETSRAGVKNQTPVPDRPPPPPPPFHTQTPTHTENDDNEKTQNLWKLRLRGVQAPLQTFQPPYSQRIFLQKKEQTSHTIDINCVAPAANWISCSTSREQLFRKAVVGMMSKIVGRARGDPGTLMPPSLRKALASRLRRQLTTSTDTQQCRHSFMAQYKSKICCTSHCNKYAAKLFPCLKIGVKTSNKDDGCKGEDGTGESDTPHAHSCADWLVPPVNSMWSMRRAVENLGATVAERLACSPSTKMNPVQSPAGSRDSRTWESCPTIPLVGGFSRESQFPPPFDYDAAPYSPQSPSSALKTSLQVKSRMCAEIYKGKLTHVPDKPIGTCVLQTELIELLEFSMQECSDLICTVQCHDGNTVRLARRSNEELGMRLHGPLKGQVGKDNEATSGQECDQQESSLRTASFRTVESETNRLSSTAIENTTVWVTSLSSCLCTGEQLIEVGGTPRDDRAVQWRTSPPFLHYKPFKICMQPVCDEQWSQTSIHKATERAANYTDVSKATVMRIWKKQPETPNEPQTTPGKKDVICESCTSLFTV
ncbi:hypothetical protein PR048_018385 [Dryococelus australis]|uniref:Uncharacterized protein n=1 Tax=Dryococelus australis TaxID=614101 RepID=A0ABQ9HCA7_9NEOP|nr:hypothetical protein PR048_018385 [Dryococelus australis]